MSRLDDRALAAVLDGDVYTDMASRRLVAQDASPYRVLPAALVRPRHAEDCMRLVAWARSEGVALIPRGGGTGLAGQCVGSGVVVDCSRYMDAVVAVGDDTVTVQPGITAGALNAALAPHGRRFGPDPSTVTRATLGGMVGNNAWGPHAPADGTTRDQVIALEAVLADGRRTHLQATDDPAAGDPADASRRQAIIDAVNAHRDAIAAAFPAPGAGLCSNNGYPLHVLLAGQPWRADGAAFNEAVLFAGAEGTLGLATEITLRTLPPRRDRRVVCPHFTRLADALAAVPGALAAGACAVELLDRHLLGLARGHPGQAENRAWLRGEPEAVLLIEFADGAAPGDVSSWLGDAYHVADIDGPGVDRVWALRRASLGLLMGEAGARNAVSGLEDTAVPVERLPEYVEAMDRLFAAEGVGAVYYGSVSLGLIHLRPLLDLSDEADRGRYYRLLEGQAETVAHFGGVLSTKHGDGRLRAPWLEGVLGAETMTAMRAVKRACDPDGLFNPGKILDAPDPLADLRAAAPMRPPATGLDWRAEGGFPAAVRRCQGAGACRQRAADGGMCPSYQATREERHATRGRANLLQQALTADDPAAALAADDLHAALELCLGCKACRHECPARVDMARLKVEALYQRHRARGMPLQARAVARFAAGSAVAGRFPALANRVLASDLVQRWLGLGSAPPALASAAATRALRRHRPAPGARGQVVVLLDPHTAWYEPGVGRAVIDVLEALGWSVTLSPPLSLGRPAISQGALDRARREITGVLATVDALAPERTPVIGLEPSELLTLRDEAPDLVDPQRVRALAKRAWLFEEFLAGPGRDPLQAGAVQPGGTLALHVHCHAKAAGVADAACEALALLPDAEVSVLRAGCCGMAGAFGYLYPEVSRDVAELALAPAVRALPEETTVVAAGTSCRQQIRRVTGRDVLHPAEVFARAICT